MKILEGLQWMWRKVTRADMREDLVRRRTTAQAKLERIPDDWRMVRDVLGDDVDDGLLGGGPRAR